MHALHGDLRVRIGRLENGHVRVGNACVAPQRADRTDVAVFRMHEGALQCAVIRLPSGVTAAGLHQEVLLVFDNGGMGRVPIAEAAWQPCPASQSVISEERLAGVEPAAVAWLDASETRAPAKAPSFENPILHATFSDGSFAVCSLRGSRWSDGGVIHLHDAEGKRLGVVQCEFAVDHIFARSGTLCIVEHDLRKSGERGSWHWSQIALSAINDSDGKPVSPTRIPQVLGRLSSMDRQPLWWSPDGRVVIAVDDSWVHFAPRQWYIGLQTGDDTLKMKWHRVGSMSVHEEEPRYEAPLDVVLVPSDAIARPE